MSKNKARIKNLSPEFFENEEQISGFKVNNLTAFALIIALLIINIYLGILCAICYTVPNLYVKLRKSYFDRSRLNSFTEDLPSLIMSVSSSIKTGLDPITALIKSKDNFSESSALRLELVALEENLSSGDTELEAIKKFGSDYKIDDLILLKNTIILAIVHGCSISKSLERIVKYSRSKQSFRRRVRAAMAMQKLSSYGIISCAALTIIFQFTTNYKGLIATLAHPLGIKFIFAGILLITTGIIWICFMTKGKYAANLSR